VVRGLLCGGGAGQRPEFQQRAGCLGAIQVAVGDDGAVVGALRAAVMGMEVLDELGAGRPQRDGPGSGVAVGIAGVIEDVAERDLLAGHRGQHGSEGADRVVPARRDRGAAGELGDGGPVFLGHHDPGGQVVAVEQLILGAQQVVLAVPPGRFGVGAVAGAVRRGPGEGFQVGPVHRQRPAGVFESGWDGCLEQGIADALQPVRRQPAGVVAAERAGDQAEGPLGLPVGQQVRAAGPVFGHAQPHLVIGGQGDQRVADPGQVRGPAVGLGEHHPGQQGADT
jgi:hypothetical protein